MEDTRRHLSRRQHDRDLNHAIFELATSLQAAAVQLVTLRAEYGERAEFTALAATLQRCVDTLKQLQPPAEV